MLQFPAERAVNAFGHRVVEVGFGCVCVPACVYVCPPLVCKWTWRWIQLWPPRACVMLCALQHLYFVERLM